MNGQWIGKYNGSTSGLLVIDLDDLGTHYEGNAYAYSDTTSFPSSYAFIRTPNKSSNAQLSVDLLALDPNGTAVTWNKVSQFYPGVNFGEKAVVNLALKENTLDVVWKTNIGTTGSAVLPKSHAAHASEYLPLPEVRNWEQFKTFVAQQEYRRYIFRGQNVTKRLRTAFHRTGRANLGNFILNDVRTLHRHLSQRTKHIFNLEIPDHNGAFLNLLQHHGYPTPLLDWTFSPFVSAFFAYRGIRNPETPKEDCERNVRIFVFDQKEWIQRFPQMSHLGGAPHFSIMEFIAIENERMIPQQSISTVTNIDDVESYIRDMEKRNSCAFLRIIDLPIGERPFVMRELTTMGITAGSLFPGLDGACEELKERFFHF